MTRRRDALLVLLLSTFACDPLTEAEHHTVKRWLLCEECVEGEQDSVVALGNRALEALGSALEGPPDEGREMVRRQLGRRYARVTTHHVSEQEYISYFLSNYIAAYQSRAAIALGRIPSPGAHDLLLGAARRDTAYREDVGRIIGTAAGVRIAIQTGDSQSALPDSFLLAAPTVLVSDSTTGGPLRNIRVRFRVDSGGGAVTDSVVRSNDSGFASVRWRLGTTDSTNILRATALGRVVRFRATGRIPGLHLAFLVQPSADTVGKAITPPVRVAVQDSSGGTITTATGDIVLSVVGTGITQVRPLVNGVAEFPSLVIPQPMVGVQVRATGVGMSAILSVPFTIVP